MEQLINRLTWQESSKYFLFLVTTVIAVLWATAMAKGIHWLTAYEFTPGQQVNPPEHWPTESCIPFDDKKYNLVIFMHGRCPCSTATANELAKIVAHTGDRLIVKVLFIRPSGVTDDWARTSLFDAVCAIPQVTAEIDADGIEARRFGAATSGQTLLYDREGRLVFFGGITSSRGHEGDNAGASTILSAVENTVPQSTHTPVFGCQLFSSKRPSLEGNASRCLR